MLRKFMETLRSPEFRPFAVLFLTSVLCGSLIWINRNFGNLDDITIGSVVGILGGWGVGIALAIGTVNYLNTKNFELRMKKYHNKIVKEIQYNKNKLKYFRDHLAISEEKWLDITNFDEVWLPKCTSIRPYSRYLFQYLPANAYHYFVTVEDFNLDSGRLERLNNFYHHCIHFSMEIQIIENEIDEFRMNCQNRSNEGDYQSYIRRRCGNLRQRFDYYKVRIDNEYNNFNPEDILTINPTQLENCP